MELPVTGSMPPAEDGPVSVRLVAVVACTEASLGSDPSESARDRFEAFLQQPIVMTVVSSLTHVAEDVRWVRCANGYEFDAVLGQAGARSGRHGRAPANSPIFGISLSP